MSTVSIENIEVSRLTPQEKYAFAILSNLAFDQLTQIKQILKLSQPGVIGPGTLSAFLQLCLRQGLDLSPTGIDTFKTKHRLDNTGPYAGVIGAQTAGVYFQEIMDYEASETTPPSDWNQAIAAAAEGLLGICTADGPDGGNNACAWSLNRILTKAGIPALGDNPNYVPSLVDALRNGRGKEVSRAEARAGDLVVANGEAHIGIGLDDGCQTVLSNSSSRARLQWQSDTDFDGYYGGPSTIYRLIT